MLGALYDENRRLPHICDSLDTLMGLRESRNLNEIAETIDYKT
jgi:hypothetical protein